MSGEWSTTKTPVWEQRCPVCEGRGNVPGGFYARQTSAVGTAPENCRRCAGTGTIRIGPIKVKSRPDEPKSA